MGKPDAKTIRRSLKKLRKMVEDDTLDPFTRRLAQQAEITLQWVTRSTCGWDVPEIDCVKTAAFLKSDLGIK